MSILIVIHSFSNPGDGAYIRVKNLNTAISVILNADVLEVRLVSLRYLGKVLSGRLEINPIFDRNLILPVVWTNRHLLARLWNKLAFALVGITIGFWVRPGIIVGETSSAWRLARAIKRFTPSSVLIADLHGAMPEEAEFNYSDPKQLERVKSQENKLEHDIAHHAELITCQSQNMVVHLQNKYPATKAHYHAFQCSVGSDLFKLNAQLRQQYRQQLGIDDAIALFVYAGSTSKWQNIDYMLQVFAAYIQTFDPSAQMLMLTQASPEQIIAQASSLGVPSSHLRVMKTAHHEVSGYLNAADIAFLIRDNSVVNQVSSPTKLGEYLACGLPVVTGEVVRDWPAGKMNMNCFCVIKLNDAACAAAAMAQFYSAWCKTLTENKMAAAQLSDDVLSNRDEVQKLESFIANQVLERRT
ncbi:MAG: glycosyltransferase [Methylomonas sp.]|nr:glycosyltransferase [Methylomonas sp.]PPD20521.1 MAG: glycosyl transferase family 1 [Methylomonas sp.]PPD26800.1 MAG: glycosyl transferase family 1 [Methylomonas sp.]PPD38664.1 MAG: glycosyl transferase family 1 [Methylomonas sp.]PPD40797.1 MAG: glycosyl transferase family 1 [Methylomonas sp.]